MMLKFRKYFFTIYSVSHLLGSSLSYIVCLLCLNFCSMSYTILAATVDKIHVLLYPLDT